MIALISQLLFCSKLQASDKSNLKILANKKTLNVDPQKNHKQIYIRRLSNGKLTPKRKLYKFNKKTNHYVLASSKSKAESIALTSMITESLPKGCKLVVEVNSPTVVINSLNTMGTYLEDGVSTFIFSGKATLHKPVKQKASKTLASLQTSNTYKRNLTRSSSKLSKLVRILGSNKVLNQINLERNAFISTRSPVIFYNGSTFQETIYTSGETKIAFNQEENFRWNGIAAIDRSIPSYWSGAIDTNISPRTAENKPCYTEFYILTDFSMKHWEVCTEDKETMAKICSKKVACLKLDPKGTQWACYTILNPTKDYPYLNQDKFTKLPKDYKSKMSRISWVFYDECHFPEYRAPNPTNFEISVCHQLMPAQINQDLETKLYSVNIKGFLRIDSYFLDNCIEEGKNMTCCKENMNGDLVTQEELFPQDSIIGFNSRCYSFSQVVGNSANVGVNSMNIGTQNQILVP